MWGLFRKPLKVIRIPMKKTRIQWTKIRDLGFLSWRFTSPLVFLSKSQEAGTALYLLRQQSSDPFEGRSNGEVLGTAGKNCRCRRDFMGGFLEKFGPQILGSCCYHSPDSFSYRGFLYFKYRGEDSQILWIRFFLGGAVGQGCRLLRDYLGICWSAMPTW